MSLTCDLGFVREQIIGLWPLSDPSSLCATLTRWKSVEDVDAGLRSTRGGIGHSLDVLCTKSNSSDESEADTAEGRAAEGVVAPLQTASHFASCECQPADVGRREVGQEEAWPGPCERGRQVLSGAWPL